MKSILASILLSFSAVVTAAPASQILKCDVIFNTPGVTSLSGKDIVVVPQHKETHAMAVITKDKKEILSQLELEISGNFQNSQWAPSGRITANPQNLDRYHQKLIFVAGSPSTFSALFLNLKRIEPGKSEQPIGISGRIDCTRSTVPYLFVNLRSGRPTSFALGTSNEPNYLNVLLSSFCIYGDSQKAFEALQASEKFTRKENLRLKTDGTITYTMDQFECLEWEKPEDDFPNCAKGRTIKDAELKQVFVCK